MVCAASSSRADDEPPPNHWPAPFGGRFHAAFTVATDYAQTGISNTQLGPAFQAALLASLQRYSGQCFLTSIELTPALSGVPKSGPENAMFHVEHGSISGPSLV